MNNKYNTCQSCGMPLSKDGKNSGSEIDGTLSKMYCSFCYKNGEFTQPDITVCEMKELVTKKIVEMKIPRFIANFLSRNTRKLKRWSK